MTTITLHAGTVTLDGTASTDYGLTGSGALWDDSSDASYFSSKVTAGSGGVKPAYAMLDTLTLPSGATVTDVTLNLRAASVSGSSGLGALFVILQSPTDGFNVGIGPTYPSPAAGGANVQGILVSTAGTITNFTHSIDSTDLGVVSKTLADLVASLEAGGKVYVYSEATDLTSGSTAKHQVYELSVDVTYSDAPPIDLPCNAWVTLPLTDAVFLTPTSGQYSDGVIWPLSGAFPDFYFPGLTLDPSKNYQVEITYDPASSHDEGTRQFWLSGVTAGSEQATFGDAQFGGLFNDSVNTTDVTNVLIGPDSVGSDAPSYWSDPDVGVSAGFDNIWFETDHGGAVSRIRIKKVCPPDEPVAPVDGTGTGAYPGPGDGVPVGPATGGSAPAALPAGGFLNQGSRHGTPTRCEVIVDGRWITPVYSWGQLQWSTCWPGGSANASWSAEDVPAALARRGASVEIRYGGGACWLGVLSEPADGQMNAVGLWSLGQDWPALDGSGDATAVVDDAIDQAIADGLPWKRLTSISSATQDVDLSQGPTTVGALLDTYATDNALRWGVDPYGVVYVAGDPAVPTWHITADWGPIAPADESFATAMKVRYYDGSAYQTVTVTDPSVAWLGTRWAELDLTGRGTLTSTKATNKAAAVLALGRARPSFATPLACQYGDLLTPGGSPVALETVKAGDLVRVHGQFDSTQATGGRMYVDVLVGAAELTDDTLTLTAMNAPVRSFMDVLAAAAAKTA